MLRERFRETAERRIERRRGVVICSALHIPLIIAVVCLCAPVGLCTHHIPEYCHVSDVVCYDVCLLRCVHTITRYFLTPSNHELPDARPADTLDTDRICARRNIRAHPRHTHEQLCIDPACALACHRRPRILKYLHRGDNSCKLDHAHHPKHHPIGISRSARRRYRRGADGVMIRV